MTDLVITRLSQADSTSLSQLLTDDEHGYRRFFTPFAFDAKSLEEKLAAVREDRYWGLWFGSRLIGFFMMRGLDQGYKRPAFGVYIANKYSGLGLSALALRYCMGWCRLNGISTMMLKVHPDNRYARHAYEKAGFTIVGRCEQTGHVIMEKQWGEVT